MSAPAGWYPAADVPDTLRWWDGQQWTAWTVANSLALVQLPHALAQLRHDVAAEAARLESLKVAIIATSDVMMLQEVGLYRYTHPADTSVQLKRRLGDVQAAQEQLVRGDGAVVGANKWVINGSDKEGAKMIGDLKKLMLRAYNHEAETLVRTMKPYGLEGSLGRLEKCRASIAKLGASMKLAVTDAYHALRVDELTLTADYLNRLAAEKEAQREERARLKEEERAQKELEAAREKLEKEKAHYESAIAKLQRNGDDAALEKARAMLTEIETSLKGVAERAANIRAGYVYVISNVGAFGPRVCKIGLTRRLDPMDRVYELGDASVPFRFDVHALIFSADAVTLENQLHQAFAAQRLNMINDRREFFYVTPEDVKAKLCELQGDLLEYTVEAEAAEWRQSQLVRKATVEDVPAQL